MKQNNTALGLGIGSVGNEGTGYDKNSGKGLEYYVTELHIYESPRRIHGGNIF